MSESFIKSNPSLEKAISAASSPEQIRELCLQSGERQGVLTRRRDGSITLSDQFAVQPAPVAAAQPEEDGPYLLKRAVRLPDGSIQLLTAYSCSGLDQLQAALRAAIVNI
jgi:hypothetical protein